MSWLFSQALVEEYSQGNCSDGVPSAQLNVMPTPHPFWRNDKTMEALSPSPFGLTLQLLTASRGAELLKWFLAAFPAKTSAQPERGPGSTESEADSGGKWRGSFAKYDRDSASWKTHQFSLLGGLEPYSETWPRWGSMRNGECWELQTWERHTNETGSGLLPTPLASIGTHGGPNQRDSSGRPGLHMAAMMWQTPVADDAVERKAGKWNSRGEPKLSAQVKIWPTPTVCGNYNRKGASKNSGDGLATAVAKWPTPTKSDGTGGPGCSGRSGGLNLRTAVANEENGGLLNPTWVEWLMGWPIGWTACEHSEMDRCRNAPQKRGVGF